MATRASIGDEIVRQDGRRFRLTGTINNQWVAEALDGPFSAPVTLSPSELATGFGITNVDAPETEQEIMSRLDREAGQHNKGYFGRDVRKQPALPPEGSPEYAFLERSARGIYENEELLARYEIGDVDFSPQVAKLLDKWIARREKLAPVEGPDDAERLRAVAAESETQRAANREPRPATARAAKPATARAARAAK